MTVTKMTMMNQLNKKTESSNFQDVRRGGRLLFKYNPKDRVVHVRVRGQDHYVSLDIYDNKSLRVPRK